MISQINFGLGTSKFIGLIAFLLLISPNLSNGKVGYSINVDVNGTNWDWSQSTNVLSFQSDSMVSGKGNCSKYSSIVNFAGNGFKDNIFAKQGTITNKNKVSIKSIDRWIHIEELVDDNSSHYAVEINESMPTIVTNKDELYYKGQGFYSNGIYSSGDKKLSLDYNADSITKLINFGGYYSNSIINVDITPGRVQVADLANSSMAFALSSMSDKYSSIRYSSDDIEMDQAYRGFYRIESELISRSMFNLNLLEDSELPCCRLQLNESLNHSNNMEGTKA